MVHKETKRLKERRYLFNKRAISLGRQHLIQSRRPQQPTTPSHNNEVGPTESTTAASAAIVPPANVNPSVTGPTLVLVQHALASPQPSTSSTVSNSTNRDSEGSPDNDPHGSALDPDDPSPDDNSNSEQTTEPNVEQPVVHPSVIQLAKLASRHNLSDICVADIIKLMHDERRRDPMPVHNFSMLERELHLNRYRAIFYWSCVLCGSEVQKSAFETPYAAKCCNADILETGFHYVLFDLVEQVKLAVEGMKYYTVKSGKARELENVGYDPERDLLLSLNTDGTPIYKSSKSSLWPILASVNNLPYLEQRDRIIILGIWVSKGTGKPVFQKLLQSFVDTIQLHRPVQWTDNLGVARSSNIFISNVMCDSMARPDVQMMSHFRAEYGCGYCYHQETGAYFSHKPIQNRTQQTHLNDIQTAAATNHPFMGVKSRTPLLQIPHLDIIKDFPVDVLHAVYLGVTEMFTNKWLNNESAGKPYYISQSAVQEIDNILASIKPPQRVSRLPRPLSERSSFKGHEWCMWLTYYSPIILKTFLPQLYYDHWLKFVNGITLLNSPEVSDRTIQRAEQLLNDFSQDVLLLYDKPACRFNVHLTRHLPDCVRRHGPLHTFTMMIFESYNKTLKSFVTSSKGVALQITKRYLANAVLRAYEDPISQPQHVEADLTTVNRFTSTTQMINQVFNSTGEIQFFKSIVVDNNRLTSKSNTKSVNRIDYLYWTKTDKVFEVYYFIKSQGSFYAAGMYHTVIPSDIPVDHVFTVLSSVDHYLLVSELSGHALKVYCNNSTYFLEFLNNVECFAE